MYIHEHVHVHKTTHAVYGHVHVCTCALCMQCTLFRLVNGLGSEKIRWGESVGSMKEEEKLLAGDVLLTASYLSYVGCFGKNYRLDLLDNKWLPFLESLDVR